MRKLPNNWRPKDAIKFLYGERVHNKNTCGHTKSSKLIRYQQKPAQSRTVLIHHYYNKGHFHIQALIVRRKHLLFGAKNQLLTEISEHHFFCSGRYKKFLCRAMRHDKTNRLPYNTKSHTTPALLAWPVTVS